MCLRKEQATCWGLITVPVLSRDVAQFPRLKCRQLLAALGQLGYVVVRQKGSHRQLKATDRPRVSLSYAEGDDVPPGVTRKVLVTIVGLSEDEALKLLEGR